MPLCGMFLSIFRAMKGNQNCVEINWKPEISIDALLDKNEYVARIFLFFSHYERTAYYAIPVNST